MAVKKDTKNNKLDDVIELNEENNNNFEDLLKEIEKIGIEAFIKKWKKNKK